jgi:hypothetical protein
LAGCGASVRCGQPNRANAFWAACCYSESKPVADEPKVLRPSRGDAWPLAVVANACPPRRGNGEPPAAPVLRPPQHPTRCAEAPWPGMGGPEAARTRQEPLEPPARLARSPDLLPARQDAHRRAQEGARAGGGPRRAYGRPGGRQEPARTLPRLAWHADGPRGRYDAQEGARKPAGAGLSARRPGQGPQPMVELRYPLSVVQI